jgi:magnesium transporter
MDEGLELYVTNIKDLIRGRKWASIRELVAQLPAPDVSDMLLELDKQEQVLFFRFLPKELSSEVFAHLDPAAKDSLTASMSDEEVRQLLADLSPDDRTEFLERLPGLMIQRMIILLSKEDLHESMQLLGYPEESVGRLMTPDYVAVRPHWTVRQSLDHIRRMGKDSETVNMVYVTDAFWHLLDELTLRKFILADPEMKVEQLMDNTFVSVNAVDDREVAVRRTKRYDLSALPVIDEEGVLLGIVTVDDILDVEEEEVTEDIQLSAAVSPLKESYRESSVSSLFTKRIGWLIGLVFINLVASGIIATYEEVLASTVALAFFIPLINAGGGNVGTQSAALIIRAQAVGELRADQWFVTAAKELAVGTMLGFGMGVITCLSGYLLGGLTVAIVVGASMFLIVVIINVIGVLMPFLLVKLGLDPATASSPLITSVADAVGLLIYFNIAMSLL